MRIIAGRFRGRRLASVGKGDAAAHLRPTSDRVRESLFSMLASRLDFDGLHVLDLFAGTGALAFEALSRGARSAVLVENGRRAQALIRENIAGLDVGDETRLLRCDACRLPAAEQPCDLIFLDPPYGKELGARALMSARRGGWIACGAVIVWEENAAQTPPDGFRLLEARPYGGTWVSLLQAAGASGGSLSG